MIIINKIDPRSCGLWTGVFVGGLHLIWSMLVMLGIAQTYLDWILGIHFLNNPFAVNEFDLTTSLTLIVFTFLVGYIVGWVSAVIWNKMLKKKK